MDNYRMKHRQTIKGSERRSYFRIYDDAILDFRLVSEEELEPDRNFEHQKLVDRLTLRARFESISREFVPILREIEASSPALAKYLSSIDKKLNILGELHMDVVVKGMNMTPQKINLGAGGISFFTSKPLPAGSILELSVVLLPEFVGIFAYARIVSCTRSNGGIDGAGNYKISVEFQRISDDVRDTIIRHVLNKEQQAMMRR